MDLSGDVPLHAFWLAFQNEKSLPKMMLLTNSLPREQWKAAAWNMAALAKALGGVTKEKEE